VLFLIIQGKSELFDTSLIEAKINGDIIMTLNDMERVIEEVDDKDLIRKYELIILEKMGWKFNNISSLETSRILIRKYFEMQG
jgi:hypothetical protein